MQLAVLILCGVIAALLCVAVVLLAVLLRRRPVTSAELPPSATPEALESAERRLGERLETLRRGAEETGTLQRRELGEALARTAAALTKGVSDLSETSGRQLERVQTLVAEKVPEQVGLSVGKTVEARFNADFGKVGALLDEVRARLTQLDRLGTGVGALNDSVRRFSQMLGNVKARGTWGEMQLGKLLEDMFVPSQFGRNVKPNPRSQKIVEFALALPGPEDGKTVWLPIDSKFPVEDYERLLAAPDEAAAGTARRALLERVRTFATQVAQYITPPHTTDFAVLFLPTDGLYLEAAGDSAMLDDLRRKHILLAGPQSLAALFNALQMGFRTLAVQKQATQAWSLLVKAKRNVEDFLAHCDTVDKRLDEAHKALEDARGRVDQLSRNLRSVTLPEEETPADA